MKEIKENKIEDLDRSKIDEFETIEQNLFMKGYNEQAQTYYPKTLYEVMDKRVKASINHGQWDFLSCYYIGFFILTIILILSTVLVSILTIDVDAFITLLVLSIISNLIILGINTILVINAYHKKELKQIGNVYWILFIVGYFVWWMSFITCFSYINQLKDINKNTDEPIIENDYQKLASLLKDIKLEYYKVNDLKRDKKNLDINTINESKIKISNLYHQIIELYANLFGETNL